MDDLSFGAFLCWFEGRDGLFGTQAPFFRPGTHATQREPGGGFGLSERQMATRLNLRGECV